MDDASCTRTRLLFQEYIVAIENDKPLTAFWTSYLDMTDMTLGLLRAAREEGWLLHFASIHAMITWWFAYDKVNYARFLPFYYATISRLPIGLSEVHQQFMQGSFSVQFDGQNPFGRIPVDQNIEDTVNRDTQTAGGPRALAW